MTLPGAAPVRANSAKMFADARAAGERIVEMTLANRTPRQIMTPAAFHNAVAAVLGVSGSINCVKHLQAIAVECGVDIDLFALFDRLGQSVPMLAAVRPNGPHAVEQLEAAGGTQAILKRLEAFIQPEAMLATGRTMGEELEHVSLRDTDIVRTCDNAYSDKPAIVIVKGTLAPDSGIIKIGMRDPGRPMQFSGPAVVHETTVGAIAAINDGSITAGQVLVLRGMGLKGGPAMGGSVSTVVFTLYAKGLTNDVAVVSDGQLSGLVNKGLVIGEVSPEAAIGGPLGLVENGDIITIDVDARSVNLEVSHDVLAARQARRGKPALTPVTGYLDIYRRQVQSMQRGGVLVADNE